MAVRLRVAMGTSRAALLLGLVLLLLLAVRLQQEDDASPGDVVRQQEPHSIERIIDGDTLRLVGGQRVRLIGVDAPETSHPDQPVEPLGHQATEFVRQMIGDQPVRLEFDRQRLDRYGRLLAYVWLTDGRLLNAELIRAGFSAAETGYPFRNDMKRTFLDAEDQARAAGVGLWREQSTGAR